jgi:hypothetical protein
VKVEPIIHENEVENWVKTFFKNCVDVIYLQIVPKIAKF